MSPPLPLAAAERRVRPLFDVHTPPRQWPGALRAAACMGIPVLVGWLAGDLNAGLTATLGGFTALYGGGRPYLNRALLLAGVAFALSAAVGVGIWAASITWVGVLTVVAIATVATLLCNALEIGPPGAYQFALVCAMGTGLHTGHHDPARAALLVLAGGAVAWLVHMIGALFGFRTPEKSAVATGSAAIGDYLAVIGTPDEAAARHRAARAMRFAWECLINHQPRRTTSRSELRRLHALNRQLHVLFADAVRSASTGTPVDPEASGTVRALCRDVFASEGTVPGTPIERLPLGRPSAWDLVRLNVTPHSRSLLVVIRVAVATTLAGVVAGLLSLDHAYWAMTAAVLVLHQGLDRRRTKLRALQRLVGTWAGLVLAAAVIAAHPHALWLVLAIMALNFLVELTVVRNYTLSVVFVTALALVISAHALPGADLVSVLLARGLDTAIGCATAVAVFALFVAAKVPTKLPNAIADTLDALGAAVEYLTPAAAATPAAMTARRDVQGRVLRLMHMFINAIDGSDEQHRAAEPTWPTIAATQRLTYQMAVEFHGMERAGTQTGSQTPCSAEYLAELKFELGALSEAVRAGRNSTFPTITPGALSEELRDVREALERQPF